MSPTRKRFVIILVVIAAFAGAGFWIWTMSQAPVSTLEANQPNLNPNPPARAVVDPNGNVSYPAPRVFPVNTGFDTNILNSSDFKALVPYVPVTITSAELGRDDPFKNY